MYDVIVVGAGPAGSLCAYKLAKSKSKLNVLIVEKAQFPRVKLCGGGVSYKAAQMLNEVIDFNSIPSTALVGSYLSYKNEHLTYVGQDITSYSLNRKDFDHAILKAAENAGCEVLLSTEITEVQESKNHVTVTTKDGKTFQAGFLVLAEGIHGRLHQSLGYSGRREITMALEIDVEPSYVPEGLKKNTLFDFGAIPSGYAWIFPKNGFFNIGAFWYRSPNIDSVQQRSLEYFIRQFDWAADGKIGKLRGHPLPYTIDYSMYNTARTLLIGDTAGTVEDFYGEGFYYGFSSSLLAVDVLNNAITENSSLDFYTYRLKSEILLQVKFSKITAHTFYTHQRFGYYKMVRNKIMNYIYANLIHGKISQRQAFFYTMLLLPVSFFSGKLKDSDFKDVGLLNNK
jgi:geranylgeranyl reductase family protein